MVPKCENCNKPDDPTRFAFFFKSKVHPATLKESELPPKWYEEYPEHKPFCMVKCLFNKCETILEL